MLKQRVITATIMLLVAVVFLLLLPNLFPLLVTAVLALMSWEWAKLTQIEQPSTRYAYIAATLLLFSLPWVSPDAGQAVVHLGQHFLWQLLTLASIVFVVLAVRLYAQQGSWHAGWQNWSRILGLWWLVNFAWVVLAIFDGQSVAWLLFAVGLVAMTDIAAYFTGKRFGRRKLAEKVSPGKTWEGVAGGVVAASTFALLVGLFADISALSLLIIGAIVSFFSIYGDLFESALKRQVGLKDSSNMLPGHGGWLDRFDAMLLALPLYWLLIQWIS